MQGLWELLSGEKSVEQRGGFLGNLSHYFTWGSCRAPRRAPPTKGNIQLNKVSTLRRKNTCQHSIICIQQSAHIICVRVKEFSQIEHTHVTGIQVKTQNVARTLGSRSQDPKDPNHCCSLQGKHYPNLQIGFARLYTS